MMSGNRHPKRLETAQNVVHDWFCLENSEAPNSLCQCGEQRQHFDAGEIHPDTGVRAGSETEMIARPSAYVETIHSRLPIRRRRSLPSALRSKSWTAAWFPSGSTLGNHSLCMSSPHRGSSRRRRGREGRMRSVPLWLIGGVGRNRSHRRAQHRRNRRHDGQFHRSILASTLRRPHRPSLRSCRVCRTIEVMLCQPRTPIARCASNTTLGPGG
jgi:hypothetical protein